MAQHGPGICPDSINQNDPRCMAEVGWGGECHYIMNLALGAVLGKEGGCGQTTQLVSPAEAK